MDAPRARTKIVATVGPACQDEAKLAELIAAGADVFRLNLAHGSIAQHDQVVDRIRRAEAAAGRPIAILADLAGPKIRLGEIVGGQVPLEAGALVRIVPLPVATAADELPLPDVSLFEQLSVGDSLVLADGVVSLTVVEKKANDVVCRVVQPGLVRSRQGINLPGVKLRIDTLGEVDREHARWAAGRELDFVGLSFVRSPDDVMALKKLLAGVRPETKTVAKIEKPEALAQLDAIVAAADAVMVARGDLGVEIDVARIAVEQKRIIATCNRLATPVITATQMLESMTLSPRPTRAEATDVANAILDGTDACMLSGETAIGRHPREAVEMMNRIMLATEAEAHFAAQTRKRFQEPFSRVHPITSAVAAGAIETAERLGARLVAVISRSGSTAIALASHRSPIPTAGLSDSPATLRQMCLYWGVIPLATAEAGERDATLKLLDRWACGEGLAQPGDPIVLVTGSRLISGAHNVVEVHLVDP
ncbi:MAG: pyruvate kinase [Pirellulales bacterium]